MTIIDKVEDKDHQHVIKLNTEVAYDIFAKVHLVSEYTVYSMCGNILTLCTLDPLKPRAK